MQILLVEDDRAIGGNIRVYLESQGMQVSWAQSIKEARTLLSRGSYDCAVLDRMLPDGSGVDLCSHIKATTTLPVILQTAKNQLDDKVEGFGVGADDYLAKPYDLGELVLRIHAVTQRNALQDRIQWRNFTFDFTRGEVTRDGEHIHLSATQLLIIQILFAYRGAIVTRSDLLDKVRGSDALWGDDNKLDVYISTLRKLLDKELIVTEKGQGYRVGV